MIGETISSAAFLASRLEQGISGASSRAGVPASGDAIPATDTVSGAKDTVSINSGTSVSVTARDKIGMDGGLREAAVLLQVADAGFARISEKLDEMKALAQIVTTTATSVYERALLTVDFSEVGDEIDKIARETEFNGMNPLAGNGEGGPFAKSYDLGNGESLVISFGSMLLSDFSPELAADNLMTEENALEAIEHIDTAQEVIVGIRHEFKLMGIRLSVALHGGGAGPNALDTIRAFGDQVDVGAEHARAISQKVLTQARLLPDSPDALGAPALAPKPPSVRESAGPTAAPFQPDEDSTD